MKQMLVRELVSHSNLCHAQRSHRSVIPQGSQPAGQLWDHQSLPLWPTLFSDILTAFCDLKAQETSTMVTDLSHMELF